MHDEESLWGRRVNAVYKSLFVPYALIFIIYIVISVLAYPALLALGFSALQSTLVLAILIGIGFLVLLFRHLIRTTINIYFRNKSRNKGVAIKMQKLCLRFLEDNTIYYSCYYTIVPKKHDISSFRCHFSWQGNMSNICIDDEQGCKALLVKPDDETGTFVDIEFQRNLIKGSTYSFGYAVLVDDPEGLIRKFIKLRSPYFPEDRLELSIILPEKKEATFTTKIFKQSNSPTPFREEMSNGKRNSYTMNLVRPVQGLCYYIGVVEN